MDNKKGAKAPIAKCDQCKDIKHVKKCRLDPRRVGGVLVHKYLCESCRSKLWELLC